MSTASLILFVIAGVLLMWQVALVILATALIKTGKYSHVKIGLFPLWTAAGFTIVGILQR